MLKRLRDIIESRQPVEALLHSAGLPLSYGVLFRDLRKISVYSGSVRSLSLKDIDDILLSYWAGHPETEQLSLLKTAILKDDTTARVFIKRLRDHELHMRAGAEEGSAGVTLEALLERDRNSYNPRYRIGQRLVAWVLPLAATVLVLFLWPRHTVYTDFNYDNDPPLSYRTEAQRNFQDSFPDSSAIDYFFVNGMKAYLACDYEQALQNWARHPANGAHIRQVRLYSALSYIGLALSKKNTAKENPEYISRAIHLFKNMEKELTDPERYFYALALILGGREEEARRQLNEITAPDMQAKVKGLFTYLN